MQKTLKIINGHLTLDQALDLLRKYQIRIIEKKIKKIENFFTNKLGHQAKLFPSGRAAIATILRFLKINRSSEVYTDKWSSHCLFNTIGAYSNINTQIYNPNLVICIHKWGKVKNIKIKKNFKIIEDSVDSIIIDKKNYFQIMENLKFFPYRKLLEVFQEDWLLVKIKNL